MSKKVYKFINNDEYAQKIAQEITEAFEKKANKNNIDYSFDIKKGTGKVKNISPNTFFAFDADKDTLLYDFKKTLFDEDLDKLTEEENETIANDLSEYLKKISSYIVENNFEKMQNTIRKNVLPNSRPEDIPLNRIEIATIDIIDADCFPEPTKYILRLGKLPNTNINSDEVVRYIQDKQEETGLSATEVYDKEYGTNPLFDDITGVFQGEKFIYDIGISMFVDYSLSQLPPKELIDKNKE